MNNETKDERDPKVQKQINAVARAVSDEVMKQFKELDWPSANDLAVEVTNASEPIIAGSHMWGRSLLGTMRKIKLTVPIRVEHLISPEIVIYVGCATQVDGKRVYIQVKNQWREVRRYNAKDIKARAPKAVAAALTALKEEALRVVRRVREFKAAKAGKRRLNKAFAGWETNGHNESMRHNRPCGDTILQVEPEEDGYKLTIYGKLTKEQVHGIAAELKHKQSDLLRRCFGYFQDFCGDLAVDEVEGELREALRAVIEDR
jgi:hypothetical protein